MDWSLQRLLVIYPRICHNMWANGDPSIPDGDLQGNGAHVKERWGDIGKLQELAKGQVLAEDIARVEQAVV